LANSHRIQAWQVGGVERKTFVAAHVFTTGTIVQDFYLEKQAAVGDKKGALLELWPNENRRHG
jgi:hypothetical protein